MRTLLHLNGDLLSFKQSIPSWISRLSDPQVQFEFDPPSYQQVTPVIHKWKLLVLVAPPPLDEISVISCKRCAYLWTYLTELIHASLESTNRMEKACTILIHKIGNTRIASNFRPIALESIPFKVFTSCLRNTMYCVVTAITLSSITTERLHPKSIWHCGTYCANEQHHKQSTYRTTFRFITLFNLKNALARFIIT